MTIFALVQSLLLTSVLSGFWGFDPPWRGHHAHHRHHGHHARVVEAVADDGAVRVRTRRGHTHVKLGAGRHGLEVWTDDRGNTRVDLGGALKVRTDERGGARVHLGDLAVDTDGSD